MTPRYRLKTCLYCSAPFRARVGRATLGCSPSCRQALRRLRALEQHLKRSPITRIRLAGFPLRQEGA